MKGGNKKVDQKKIGSFLKELRKEKGITQEEFAEKLKKFTEIQIEFQDERLSTVSAERILLEGNVRRDKRKGVVDKIAATIILQNYLDKNAYKNKL